MSDSPDKARRRGAVVTALLLAAVAFGLYLAFILIQVGQ